MKLKGKSRIQIGLLLLPGLLIFCIFTVYPIIRLFWMSFFKWDFGSFLNQEFIGLSNYRSVLTDPYFQTSFVNTIVYTLVTVPAQMILGLLVAILINSINRFKIGFRVAYYLPVITSWVIASLVFKYVFNTEGLLNYFLTGVIHVTGANIHWLDSRWGGMTIAIFAWYLEGYWLEYGCFSCRAAGGTAGTVRVRFAGRSRCFSEIPVCDPPGDQGNRSVCTGHADNRRI